MPSKNTALEHSLRWAGSVSTTRAGGAGGAGQADGAGAGGCGNCIGSDQKGGGGAPTNLLSEQSLQHPSWVAALRTSRPDEPGRSE